MYRLENETRQYAWGSRDFIPALLGRPPAAAPEAELWLGAHPAAPSRIPGAAGTLQDLIEADPVRQLGAPVNAEYPQRLPFLFKVLAAEQPLSLQAHPSAAQARAGYAAEEAAGVSLDDPKRSYCDPFGKPELFVALTACDVLCGFRPAADAARILSRLGISELGPYVASLLTGRAADGLRVVVTTLLTMPIVAKQDLAGRVVAECRRVATSGVSDGDLEAYRWAVELGEAYPGDVGAVLSLLLNLVRLEPGQAVFVRAGMLHAYLSGAGLEAQGNSDNTLRCGLTPKHVDVVELLRVLDFEPVHDIVIDPHQVADDSAHCVGARTWPTPAREFALFDWQIDDGTRHLLQATGPSIVLCLDGEITLHSREEQVVLAKGQSAYLPAYESQVSATGPGRLTHITVGQVPRSR